MATTKHAYLQSHQLGGTMLTFDTATEGAKVSEQSASSKQGRAAKTLVKEGKLRIAVLALQKGTVLASHKVDGDLSIHVLRGALEIRTLEGTARLSKGGVTVLEAGVSHDARALRDTTALLTTSMR